MTASVRTKTHSLTVVAYAGDAKTLLAFNLAKRATKNLAGFTIQCCPRGRQPYYLYNTLRFEHPERHAQVATEPPTSSINAPFHKFRWVHVPGSFHQGLKPFYGPYTYVVTPRYFDAGGSLKPIDTSSSVSVEIEVKPFESKGLELAFTRGYTQSQAFVNHFGPNASIRPAGDDLLFDTSQQAGTNAYGDPYTYRDEYEWLGFTAREKVFDLLNGVLADPSLRLDVFAYDLDEPDVVALLLELAEQGRIRVVLDDAALHHNTKTPKPEDRFEQAFRQAAKAPAAILRGHFRRYAHDKILIVSAADGPKQVLTGSTNFSVTGFYVNSNHVLVFSDPAVVSTYAELFETVWAGKAKLPAYLSAPLSGETFSTGGDGAAPLEITFAPHSEQFAGQILDGIVERVGKESKKGHTTGSVLFAVMQIDDVTNPVYAALDSLHASDRIFTYGISDSPDGIALYAPGKATGVLVTGKPVRTQLPPPFNQVPGVGSGHQIHHKFVVCGFNGADPVVYCGSSNLALGGEQVNGDNLLELHDRDVATAFAIEAPALVDHFQFLDRAASGSKPKTTPPPASSQAAAVAAGWFLSTSDRWVAPYYDKNDLHYVDRLLFT